MKKQIQHIILAAALLTGASACNKYLDVKPEGKVLLTTFEDYNKVINFTSIHIYPDAETRYLSDWAAINEIAIVGRDPSLASISYLFEENRSRFPFLISGNDGTYGKAYGAISRYNLILQNIDKITDGTAVQIARLKAEARTLRAYVHFVMLNLYARPYNPATASGDNSICIKKDFDLETLEKPVTVAQAYDFIETELRQSVGDLAQFPDNAFHPSKAFGYGLLAKMHLYKREFAKAKEAAQQSLASNNYIFDLVKYYNEGQVEPVDIGMQENLYYGITGNTNNTPYTYTISKEMVAMFGTQDTRMMALFSTTSPVVQNGSGTASFIKNVSGAGRYCYNAAGMRTTEVYLTLAECLCREGNVSEAMKLVNDIRRKRMLPAGYVAATAATPAAALDTVLVERRKELLFGHNRFWDQRRLAQDPGHAVTVVRKFPVVVTTVPQQTYTLQPGSHLYVIPFDRNVIINNPNIVQNTSDAMDL
ncbi:RagB/SusD family nutrient uptake outer membrane protein [Chitinophaga sp. NPDC101104]|uniref:RagB/SusD family nutrient uptake outer membrane protein n=1 Tax=Chitinophaga sp. NPDC101104 TaxID=3390561 RepID=UPI003D052C85